MREILVIRFGALGDLCVLSWALARLADQDVGRLCRITVATKAAFAPLMAQMRGVDDVIALEGTGPGAVRHLARRLKQRRFEVVIDAHNILRSHLLLGLCGRRPDMRLAKDTAARLSFMTFGRRDRRLNLSMRDRFDAMTAPLVAVDSQASTLAPLHHLRVEDGGSSVAVESPAVGLAPGAQWDTKRWPQENFAALLSHVRDRTDARVRIYLGPREQTWYPDSSLARAAAADSAVEVVLLPNLPEVARHLASVAVLVTNDSGLLHLAEAVGTPVLALFGPTVREFGYFPLLKSSRVLETELSCRPCSRNGKRPCHRQDLACLTAISPEQVLDNLLSMLTKDRPS